MDHIDLISALAERIKWEGADIDTPEAAALKPVIDWKIGRIFHILTDGRITSAEGFRAAFYMTISEAVMQGYQVGLAAGKHHERERRRQKV